MALAKFLPWRKGSAWWLLTAVCHGCCAPLLFWGWEGEVKEFQQRPPWLRGAASVPSPCLELGLCWDLVPAVCRWWLRGVLQPRGAGRVVTLVPSLWEEEGG